MRKLLLFFVSVIGCIQLQAQPWMPATINGPVKYVDALERYRIFNAKNSDGDRDNKQQFGEEQEGKDHLFESWNYYWKQHLDKDGYMVPPSRNFEEWQKYLESQGTHKTAKTTAIPSNWVFQGPSTCDHGYSGLGRINLVAFDPVDSNTFYIGSAASCTWKTTDGGNTWAPLYDFLPKLGVADIKINPLNRNTIYVATGDGDAGDAYSSGVIVSHDAGAHWATAGLSWAVSAYTTARCLIINPLDTASMMFGTSAGLYRSHNGGISWTTSFSGNFKQILYNPADTTIVYGSMYTDTSSQIMRSTDGGSTWTAVTSFTDAQRISLAICPSSPSVVKALVSNNSSGLEGIYNSSDNGASYSALYTDDSTCTRELLGYELSLPTTSCGGQGWYDLCIAINPANVNEVTIGGVNTYFSADGGSTWNLANQWYTGVTGVATVHADKHCLAYNPLSGALFETCDGGVYKNYGPLAGPWTDLTNGLCITEFYRNAVDNNVSFCIGGAQDNGTKMVDGTTSTDLFGGDGMQPLINYGDPANIWYVSYQNGATYITRDAGANYASISDTLHSSGGWISPFVLHPTDTATLVMAYKQVYASYNNGLSWTSISPVFDTNSYMDRLAIAHSNPNYLYVTYYDYSVWQPSIYYTPDFGLTWNAISTPFTSYISDLIIDPSNEQHIWVTSTWYGQPKVWSYDMSTNVWTNESGTLPDISVNCILIDTSSRTLYAGTDVAVFYKDTTMVNWALYNTNLPAVHVDDLHINYATNELWAATFGRGMWKSVKVDHTSSLATTSVVKTAGSVSISPNPSRGTFTIRCTGNILLDKNVSVKLLMADGKEAWQTTGRFENNGSLKISASGLAAGFYICEVSNSNGVVRSKVVVY